MSTSLTRRSKPRLLAGLGLIGLDDIEPVVIAAAAAQPVGCSRSVAGSDPTAGAIVSSLVTPTGMSSGYECDFGHNRPVIGIIGPEDSVARARNVAAELGLAETVLARTYVTWDAAPELAIELDAACTVLLFTGRVPYTIARETLGLRATLDFIPHEGADLYRALVGVLREHRGRLPVISIDTIERFAVDEIYHDLDLEPPAALLSFDDRELRARPVAVDGCDRLP